MSEPHQPTNGRALVDSRRGTSVRIVDIAGSRRLVQRLASLGLVPGIDITVLRPTGPALVAFGGARIAIGRDAARAVLVSEV